ncbi:50S ribosomal protein L4 [Candidatus Curtissbacteria bacterium RIFCSPLOWO2_01_FULL_38_11b]|uniref:Large ribosomal subunit protein uL4 n=1 Tax=Candidatus Curtissbacteria bacterium RIFCSPLOWO2_01_FULL_38_11b TaxID=1797725 RepID=A0A1F5H045_9BACT|nr:MAG: 50S ribosomal protein L4 [Candidatus Curtissbacteria bacterium RIFCSPLOWO2_01_FULL_38_11b]
MPKLKAELFDISGKKQGTIALPYEVFGQKVNKKLLAQALHIYFVNRSKHAASAKTRSEVRGGGAKPWRQKGTGRARAGSRRSPLWVGGAKALAPKHRESQLILPKKMKRAALISALSSKVADGAVIVITNIEKMPPKTKIIDNFFKKLETKGSSLFIISKNAQNSGQTVKLAARNIQKTSVDTANNLNAFEIIKNQNIFMSKEALLEIPSHFNQVENNSKGNNI